MAPGEDPSPGIQGRLREAVGLAAARVLKVGLDELRKLLLRHVRAGQHLADRASAAGHEHRAGCRRDVDDAPIFGVEQRQEGVGHAPWTVVVDVEGLLQAVPEALEDILGYRY